MGGGNPTLLTPSGKTMPFNWDEESKNKLREFWSGGLSASLIGKEMGLTKNSIIGAANRMKLPPRVKPPAFTARSCVSKKQEQPVEAVENPAPVVAEIVRAHD
jgi:GcrA cell cycle regulator